MGANPASTMTLEDLKDIRFVSRHFMVLRREYDVPAKVAYRP
jgi:hypothetical protein